MEAESRKLANWQRLIRAVRNQDLEGVKALLTLNENELDVNYRTTNGYTALYLACCHGHLDIAIQLLTHPRADVNISDEVGWTPLCAACYYLKVDVIKAMFKYKGHILDVNASTYEGGIFPLIAACEKGLLEVMHLLLEDPKIKVNQVTHQRWSALNEACFSGLGEEVKMLLRHPDIDIQITNDEGTTPFSSARERGHQNLCDIIERYKASYYPIEREIEFVKIHLKPIDYRFPDACGLLNDLYHSKQAKDHRSQLLGLMHQFVECPPACNQKQLKISTWSVYVMLDVDYAKQDLLATNGIPALAREVARKDAFNFGFRNISDICVEARIGVAQAGPEFEEYLSSMAKQSFNEEFSLDAVGIIVSLAGLSPKMNQLTLDLGKDLFEVDDFQMGRVFDCLLVACSTQHSNRYLREIQLEKILQQFEIVMTEESCFVVSMLLALWASDPVSTLDLNQPDPRFVEQMISKLKLLATCSLTGVDSSFDFQVSGKTVLNVLSIWCRNQGHFQIFKQAGVIQLFTEFMQNRMDYLENNLEALEQAALLVWSLAYDVDSRKYLIEKGIIDILRLFQGINHFKASQAISGALWKLNSPDFSQIQNPLTVQTENGFAYICDLTSPSKAIPQLKPFISLFDHSLDESDPMVLDDPPIETPTAQNEICLEKSMENVDEANVVMVVIRSKSVLNLRWRFEVEYAWLSGKPMRFFLQCAHNHVNEDDWLRTIVGNQERFILHDDHVDDIEEDNL